MSNRLPSLQRYSLIARLGGGPMTEVFSARDRQTEKIVALKILTSEAMFDEVSVTLLHREAEIGLSVSHPHLVRYLSAETQRSPYFIVMERLPGESLAQKLRREKRIGLATCLRSILQVTRALSALHQKGYLHGDIKPENVLLVDSLNTKLIDLGFAHRPGENDELLGEGFILGTANYVAPELCHDSRADSLAVDVYALGLLICESLTGELPFPQEDSSEKTMWQRRYAQPVWIPPTLAPEPLQRLVYLMTSPNPIDRPSVEVIESQISLLELALFRRAG